MNILIGISGGIAAYKIPYLIRLFVKNGDKVKVIASNNALEFVTPMTLQTLSGNNVYKDMFTRYDTLTTEHISLAQWADCFIVAPATADIIGKMANGIADDCLTTSLLAFTKPIFICPAMNDRMYHNFAVEHNLNTLKNNNINIIGPEVGLLACGSKAIGAMSSEKDIFDSVQSFFSHKGAFEGKRVLLTAGPTIEKIDAVRYITNNSTGKMGYALAKELINQKAKVTIISGPVNEDIVFSDKNLDIINILSSEQMYDKTTELFGQYDIAICCAAVSDYRPKEQYDYKLKKTADNLTLSLVPTKDILLSLGKNKRDNQLLIGFALETDNPIDNAIKKLKNKNLDLIVLNCLKDQGAGFGYNTNKITIIDRFLNQYSYELKDKKEVAKDILDQIIKFSSDAHN